MSDHECQPKGKKRKQSASQQQTVSVDTFSQQQTVSVDTLKSQDKAAKLQEKSEIYQFLTSLLRVNMSDKVLVDITINNDPEDNKIIIVGRPPVLGSATKQMRHVTPYAFIASAIKAKVVSIEDPKTSIVKDTIQIFVEGILDFLLPIHKGICLTESQYLNLQKRLEQGDYFDIKMTTINDDHTQKNVYYLISNPDTLKEWQDDQSINDTAKQEAEQSYQKKFHKYIKYGLEYLKEMIPKDSNTLTITCEGIARLILTIFNQEQGACFPTEGNSLLEVIHLYNTSDDAKQAVKFTPERQAYSVKSHKEIIQIIKNAPEKYQNPYIRIIDNEGAVVQRAAKALSIIDDLLSQYDAPGVRAHNESSLNLLYTKYNKNLHENQLRPDNFQEKYPDHVATHLYSVFDFKPLEEEVLAPKLNGNVYSISFC